MNKPPPPKPYLPLLIALTLVIGMLIGYRMSGQISGVQDFFVPTKKSLFDELLYLIDTRYVDSVDLAPLVESKSAELLRSLDPHSVYIQSKYVPHLNEELKGGFEGIGIEYHFLNDTPIVLRVLPDGPAQKAGLQKGDRLLWADTTSLLGKGEQIKNIIKGPSGTDIELTFLRKRQTQRLRITRKVIPLKSVPIYANLDSITGYIKLDKFMGGSVQELTAALESLQARGCRNLILDLRNNGGGLLDAAIDIADEFLSDDKLIVYTKGLHAPKKEYRCRRKGRFEEGGLIVLINSHSASASEVLAGALQDWDRATIIGETSFGKGLVQEQFELENGSALRLTVARYFTPSGRCIQKKYALGTQYQEYTHLQRDSLRRLTDTFRTSKGRIVFGEGGIEPDLPIIEITDDTDQDDTLFYPYVSHFYKTHLDELLPYEHLADFDKNFYLTQKQLRILMDSIGKKGVPISQSFLFTPSYIQTKTKTLLEDFLFPAQALFEKRYLSDPYIQKALTLLHK